MRRTDSKEDGQREEFDLNKFRESMHFLQRTCVVPGAYCVGGYDRMFPACRYRISESW